MTLLSLDHLKAHDLPELLDELQRYFQRHQFQPLRQNVFLTPRQLAERWEMSESNLNHWRCLGYGPVFAKLGPGVRAKVRYPLFGGGGVLSFEQQNQYASTVALRHPDRLSPRAIHHLSG